MTSTDTVSTWVGREVALWPGDTYVRHATVVSVDDIGWEFAIQPGGFTGTKPGYRAGDSLYVSHSQPLTLCELDD